MGEPKDFFYFFCFNKVGDSGDPKGHAHVHYTLRPHLLNRTLSLPPKDRHLTGRTSTGPLGRPVDLSLYQTVLPSEEERWPPPQTKSNP